MNIGILGGGLTGVTLGYHLNHNIEIIEKNNKLGGLCRSLHDEGFTFDYGGSHVIFSKDKEILNFMLTMLGDNKTRIKRNTKVLYKGNYVKYPFENGLDDLPKQDNFECLYYYIDNLIKRDRGKLNNPKNFKEWIYYTFGRGIAEKYMIPYNEKIWNTKTELMGLDWVENRVPQPPVRNVIKSALGISTEGYTHQLYFYYPKRGGIQAIIKSISTKVAKNLVPNFEVKSIKKEEGKWVVASNNEEKIFDKIISTIHLQDLIKGLKDVPKDVVEAANRLRYNSLITVMIGVDIPKINNFSWVYVPDKEIKTHRVSFPSNFSKYATPEGKSSVLAEITCSQKEDIWRQKAEVIAEEVIEEMNRLKIIDEKNVCYVKVKKSEYAYVVDDLGYLGNLGLITEFIKREGIELCGRFSEFKYLNMDACIRSAMNTAKKFNNLKDEKRN
jgi:protoporphyrinogen oxidase